MSTIFDQLGQEIKVGYYVSFQESKTIIRTGIVTRVMPKSVEVMPRGSMYETRQHINSVICIEHLREIKPELFV